MSLSVTILTGIAAIYTNPASSVDICLAVSCQYMPLVFQDIGKKLINKFSILERNQIQVNNSIHILSIATEYAALRLYSKYTNFPSILLSESAKLNIFISKMYIMVSCFMFVIYNSINYFGPSYIDRISRNLSFAINNISQRFNAVENKNISETLLNEVAPLKSLGLDNLTDNILMENNCPICLDTLNTTQLHRSLPCKHTFHAYCCDSWVLLHNKCPICRNLVVTQIT